MRILYTHRTQGKGAEGAHISGMVEAFRALGHDVVVDCLAGGDPTLRLSAPGQPDRASAASRVFGRVIAALSAHTPQWLFGLMELLYNLPLALRLLPKLLIGKPDLVYERYALCTFVPVLACRMLGIAHVLEVNDSVVIDRSRPLKLARLSRFLERRILRSTSQVVTISEQFKQMLVSGMAIPEGVILVCPNAVSRQHFIDRSRLTPQAREALRARHAVGGRRVIGSAGQFVAWHGLPAFVAAAAACIREMDLFVLFIGDGPAREETLAAARTQGIADRVVFTGMLPHEAVPDYLQILDVAIIPYSNVHGSPMKLMEFMAMSLPVVAPELPPILEVLRDQETGFLFPYDDMAAMVRTLERCLTDPAGTRRVGLNARAFVTRHLTWDAHARKVLHRMGMAS